ncbi:hypothetical protein N7491_005165 [Penicillium cf. griseofulvum]|uniref:Uncharacterized protein n=1 Tax=Penicillium cf. griseofulvum TaxID=2972120 RepID=A0A9W9M4V1_9EURO|nr:hypothetical protein N7472_007858 [Penicillium cf. griseofulvum]KAJ5434570.1 hypothetical protein N7491_005165 [Penicillium cf. griseofulvum]KAJ5452399.1 hypothetical protein N7445_000582 [Penicillium cf. griseofulvum]
MTQSNLMWLAHVLPAIRLTIISPDLSFTLLIQTVTGAVEEESSTVSFDCRQTVGSDVDITACAVNLLLNGADIGSSILTADSWKAITKQWTAVSSEVDMFILIDCSDATIPGQPTSTVFTIRTATITAYPSTVTNYPAINKTTWITTETNYRCLGHHPPC